MKEAKKEAFFIPSFFVHKIQCKTAKKFQVFFKFFLLFLSELPL